MMEENVIIDSVGVKPVTPVSCATFRQVLPSFVPDGESVTRIGMVHLKESLEAAEHAHVELIIARREIRRVMKLGVGSPGLLTNQINRVIDQLNQSSTKAKASFSD